MDTFTADIDTMREESSLKPLLGVNWVQFEWLRQIGSNECNHRHLERATRRNDGCTHLNLQNLGAELTKQRPGHTQSKHKISAHTGRQR